MAELAKTLLYSLDRNFAYYNKQIQINSARVEKVKIDCI